MGGLTISIGVGVAQPGESSVQSGIEIRRPEVGEYSLEVIFDEDRNQYQFQLRSDVDYRWPWMNSVPFLGKRQDEYAETFSRLNTLARNPSKLSPEMQTEWLIAMGAMLYRLLVPDALKRVLWENRDKIKYLNILSPAEPLPWELLCISDPEDTVRGNFLADTATVTRWGYGPHPVLQLSKKNPYFVLPNGAPSKAQAEVAYARQ